MQGVHGCGAKEMLRREDSPNVSSQQSGDERSSCRQNEQIANSAEGTAFVSPKTLR